MKIRKIAAAIIITLAASALMSASAFASFTTPDWAKKSADQCAACSGTGSTDCTWCKGTGQMSAAGTSYTCITCSGTGKAACLGCNGTGKKKESGNTQASPDTGDTCSTCSGAGTTSCTWCKGTGQMSAGGTSYTCITCSGTGKVQCLGCSGTGKKREFKKENPITVPGDLTLDPDVATDIYGYRLGTGVTCPICNGAGQRVCSSCSGYGYTETMNSSVNYGYGSTPYWTKKSCAACHHTGLVPCTYCGGDGVR